MSDIRALSPDPNFLARKEAEARLEEAHAWETAIDAQLRAQLPCIFTGDRIAKLESELAAKKEGK